MIQKIKIHEAFYWFFLLGYHLVFTYFNWTYYLENDGDASHYWLQSDVAKNASFSDLIGIGTEVVQLLNFPLVRFFELNIFFGFLLYSLIGYLGLIQFYRLGRNQLGNSAVVSKIDVLKVFLLLPNLHYWTAGLGKESLCFVALATFFLDWSQKNRFTATSGIAFIGLALLRPHIALFLLLSVLLSVFFSSLVPRSRKVLLSGVMLFFLGVLFYVVLQLTEIKYPDWERIQRFNTYSLLSFQHSNTYVPMEAYSYPFRIVTFWFRPFPGEVNTLYGWILGIENLIWLLLHVVAAYLLLKNYRKLHFQPVFKVILLFALISMLIIVQRYSGFGIFARTKIMMQPFVGVVLMWIFVQSSSRKIV